jgi:hypothetical protein
VRAVVAAGLLALMLAGCSPEAAQQSSVVTPTPIPSTVGGTVPVPTNTLTTVKPTDAAVPPELPEEATAPPPPTAGPLGARNLPAPEKLGAGWKTYADPGGAEAGFVGNNTWTRKRDAHQAAFEALPSGCSGSLLTGHLPVPQYALAGTYRTADAQPATALLLRFTNSANAKAYYDGYHSRMAYCGTGGDLSVKQLWSEPTAAAAVRAYAGAESYVDISVAEGSTVALLATTSGHPETQSDWAHSVVPTLQATIDSP